MAYQFQKEDTVFQAARPLTRHWELWKSLNSLCPAVRRRRCLGTMRPTEHSYQIEFTIFERNSASPLNRVQNTRQKPQLRWKTLVVIMSKLRRRMIFHYLTCMQICQPPPPHFGARMGECHVDARSALVRHERNDWLRSIPYNISLTQGYDLCQPLVPTSHQSGGDWRDS